MTDNPREIWPPAKIFYIHSMLFATNSAMQSFDVLNAEFEGVEGDVIFEQVGALNFSKILDGLQNVVLQAGVISKYFWPIRSSHHWRGHALREAFGISDDHPLKSRSLRDAIEHFDERLDRYLEHEVIGVVLPEYVGPRPQDSGVSGHFFRAYFIEEGVFRLLNEEYKIAPIADALLAIHSQLLDFDAKGGTFPGVKAPQPK
ncbi:hypothetical protein ACEI36_13440 [Pseudomonas kielensis]|uniref:hypothetical protein n=1 Tax=Pseudomonas kielensis TaxID=2762577 RepID=UPI0038A681B9